MMLFLNRFESFAETICDKHCRFLAEAQGTEVDTPEACDDCVLLEMENYCEKLYRAANREEELPGFLLTLRQKGGISVSRETPTLERLQSLVGGHIETVPILEIPGGVMILNEEGKLNGLRMNLTATAFMHTFPRDFAVGDAVICKAAGEGLVGLNGDELVELLTILDPFIQVDKLPKGGVRA